MLVLRTDATDQVALTTAFSLQARGQSKVATESVPSKAERERQVCLSRACAGWLPIFGVLSS